LRHIISVFKYFLVTVFLVLGIPYLIPPVYNFTEPQPFKGNLFYNPYADIDSNKWLKSNFHEHSNVWSGMTSGKESTVEDIKKTYKELNYDIIGISDYMLVNPESDAMVYEYSLSLSKSHYLVFGDSCVKWFYIPFIQNVNQKQFMINYLKSDRNYIAVAHPSMVNAFSFGDIKYLTNYDLIEIIRHERIMLDYFDTVLSNGHKVFLLAGDDGHNIKKPTEVGEGFTLINSPSKSQSDLMKSLKAGKSIGVKHTGKDESLSSKTALLKTLPVITAFDVDSSGYIKIKLNRKAPVIYFVGQGGIVKKEVLNSDTASYKFSETDTYIRTVAVCEGYTYYLNPVFRYEKNTEIIQPSVNSARTLIIRVSGALSVFTAIFLLIYSGRKKE